MKQDFEGILGPHIQKMNIAKQDHGKANIKSPIFLLDIAPMSPYKHKFERKEDFFAWHVVYF